MGCSKRKTESEKEEEDKKVHPGNLGETVVRETLRPENNNFIIFYLTMVHIPTNILESTLSWHLFCSITGMLLLFAFQAGLSHIQV